MTYTVVNIIQYLHAVTMNHSLFMEAIEKEERMNLMVLCSLPIPLVELWTNDLKIIVLLIQIFLETRDACQIFDKTKRRQCDLHISLM